MLAASIDEIGASRLSLAIVFVTTFRCILVSYRSLVIAVAAHAGVARDRLARRARGAGRRSGSAIDVNTLPGSGDRRRASGVDYAIYLVDRMLQERTRLPDARRAVRHAIRTTGLAITFTASTLLVGIAFWIPISSLRFSAEMSLLLSILMIVDALGAILLVPAMIVLLPKRWAGSSPSYSGVSFW